MSIGPEDWKRLKNLFDKAKGLNPDEWAELVWRTFPDRGDLRQEAIAMLEAAPPTTFMDPVQLPAGLDELFGEGLKGKRIGGFELLRELGQGGMGVVYLARQEGLERTVALKLLPLSRARDPVSLERFRREAKAASQLEHPAIVPVLSFGEGEHTAWYAMGYVEGHDLAAEITAQSASRQGPSDTERLLPPFESSTYVGAVARQVAELAGALQHAHNQGVVHRDVKPQNIILDSSGRMHLVDFGLAKDERFGTLTETGAIQGTPFYMSPEQARAGGIRIDHRTDIYSLSVVLYESLSLRKPHEGRTSYEVIQRIAGNDPPPLRRLNARIPRDLEVICAKGMAKSAQDRYPTAGELQLDLERFLSHRAIEARPPTPRERATRWVRRHRGPVLGAGVALLVGLAVLLFSNIAARERAHGQIEKQLDALLSMEGWSGSHDVLLRARLALEATPSFGNKQNYPRGRMLKAFAERLERFRANELARGEAEFQRGILGEPLGGSAPEGSTTAPSIQRMQAGLLTLERLAQVFPEDAELERAASVERSFPRVGFEVQVVDEQRVARAALPGEAEILVATYDPHTDVIGPYSPLGDPGDGPFPLATGWWRFEVRVPGHGTSPHLRNLTVQAAPHSILSRVHPRSAIQADMVAFEGGRFRPEQPIPLGCFPASGVEVPPFHLDRFEVSNGRYAAYLEETGADPPNGWKALGYRTRWSDMDLAEFAEAWPDLPATMVTLEDARAFAEWHGKRLPLHSELDLAIAELPNTLPPLGENSLETAGFANAWENTPDYEARPGEIGSYHTSFEPLVSTVDARFAQGPREIHHLFGNVMEWTASPALELRDARLILLPATYLALGSFWNPRFGDNAPTRHSLKVSLDTYTEWHVGWRCAH